MTYYGDFPASHTAVCMVFDSFAAATGASSATSNFASSDILIYKDGGTTQRSSANGITVSTSFDSQTGLQMIAIDLSDNTDAGFYAAGHEYQVGVADVTIDTQTVRFWLGCFSIERANGVLALIKGNAIKVDVNTIKTNPVVNGGTATFPTNATLASTTNITAGTITTTTNLTTNNDKTGYGLSAAAVQAIWDALTSALTTVGSVGKLIVDTLSAMVAAPANFSSLSIDAGGVVKSNLAQILGTALTETAGLLAGGFKKFFNVASPTLTCLGVDQTGDSFGRIGATGSGLTSLATQASVDAVDDYVDTEVAAILAAVDTEVAAIKAKTDNLPTAVKKNTALAKFMFKMVDSADHVTPKTGLTVACQRSIDGAAFANCNSATATEIGSGWYYNDMAASDLNGNVIALKFTSAGADQRDIAIVTNA